MKHAEPPFVKHAEPSFMKHAEPSFMKHAEPPFVRRAGLSLMNPARLSFTPSRGGLLWGHATSGLQRLGCVLLLGFSVIAVAVSGWQLWTLDEMAAREHAALALRVREAARALPARPAAPSAASREQARQWHQLSAQLGTPWLAILDILERHAPPGIAVLAVEPDVQRRSVRLHLEARSLDPLLAFADTLRSATSADGVRLIRHDTDAQAPNQPVRLTLEFTPP
jgi:hypothetical protein